MATQARKYSFRLIDFSSTSHKSRLFLIKFLNSVALFGSTAASFVEGVGEYAQSLLSRAAPRVWSASVGAGR